MRSIEVRAGGEFDVLATTPRSQAATMVLEPGETTGGPDNRHEESDPWLYVISGRGEALVDGKETPLEPGRLLLIEAGEAHEVRAGRAEPLVTLNFYAPPEY